MPDPKIPPMTVDEKAISAALHGINLAWQEQMKGWFQQRIVDWLDNPPYVVSCHPDGTMVFEQDDQPPPKLNPPYLIVPVRSSIIQEPTCPHCGQPAPHLYIATWRPQGGMGFGNLSDIKKLTLS